MKVLVTTITLLVCIGASVFLGWIFGFSFDNRGGGLGFYTLTCMIISAVITVEVFKEF